MDERTHTMATKDADSGELHSSKLAHPPKTTTKDGNRAPGYKASVETKCDSTASCHASTHNKEDGVAPGTKNNVTPAKTGTETSKTNVSDPFLDGVDTPEPKQSAKKTKIVKKGIAQVVKKKANKGGWKYVEELEIAQDIGKRQK